MKKTVAWLSVLGTPFLISYAFYTSEWIGWPALLVGGLHWIGSCIIVTEKEKQ